MHFTEGDRVYIQIQDSSRWAARAAESIGGNSGTVREVKEHSVNGKQRLHASGPSVLVELDELPRPWHTHQRPGRCWWLLPEDLMKTGQAEAENHTTQGKIT